MPIHQVHGTSVDLPYDYVLAPTEEIADQLIATMQVEGIQTPNYDQYGGADISIAVDGAGTNYVMFCAKKLSTGVFGAYIIDITHNNSEVPYSPFCTGRGEVNNAGRWIAWRDKDYFWGTIQGFVPHPAPVDYGPQIAALQKSIDDLWGHITTQSARIDHVVDSVTALTARVAALEAQPTGGSGLTDRERESLNWLVGWLAPLLDA